MYPKIKLIPGETSAVWTSQVPPARHAAADAFAADLPATAAEVAHHADADLSRRVLMEGEAKGGDLSPTKKEKTYG